MRFLIFLGLSILSASALAEEPNCKDLLLRNNPKPYFSLLFKAAGGQFLTDSELAEAEGASGAGSSQSSRTQVQPLQNWGDDFPEIIPFEDARINEIAIRMRSVLIDPAFSKYRDEKKWTEFQVKYMLPQSVTEQELGRVLWAAFTMAAIRGDLSMVYQWITDRISTAWQDFGPEAANTERMLIKFGFADRLRIYQAADELLTATEEWEAKRPPVELGAMLLDWAMLTEALSPAELFMIKQALSWTPRFVRPFHVVPENFQAAVDLLMLELAAGNLSKDTISVMETLLSSVSEEEEIIHSATISQWPEALDWIRSHKESAAMLVRDVVEFRKFFPEIR